MELPYSLETQNERVEVLAFLEGVRADLDEAEFEIPAQFDTDALDDRALCPIWERIAYKTYRVPVAEGEDTFDGRRAIMITEYKLLIGDATYFELNFWRGLERVDRTYATLRELIADVINNILDS